MLAPPCSYVWLPWKNLHIAWCQNLLFCVLHSATAPRDCGSAPRVRAKGRGVREDKMFFPLLSFVPIMAIGICEHFLGIWRERDLEKGAFLLIYLGPILRLLSFYSIKYNTRHDILHLSFIITHSTVASTCQWQFQKDWTKVLLPICLQWPSIALSFLNKDVTTKLPSSGEANIRRGLGKTHPFIATVFLSALPLPHLLVVYMVLLCS